MIHCYNAQNVTDGDTFNTMNSQDVMYVINVTEQGKYMFKLEQLQIELNELARLKCILGTQINSIEADMEDVKQEIEQELRIGYFI
jgi:hypothetical protein